MLRKHDSATATTEHEYVHRDHLGSITALTREFDGSVIERYSYDAWGKRRNATNWTSAVTSVYESRGYTGHEHLDDIEVIHMNGRIYSPKLGRMLSPDPVTQAPNSGRNYNRYTYVGNNPVRYTDPTGYRRAPYSRGSQGGWGNDGGSSGGDIGSVGYVDPFNITSTRGGPSPFTGGASTSAFSTDWGSNDVSLNVTGYSQTAYIDAGGGVTVVGSNESYTIAIGSPFGGTSLGNSGSGNHTGSNSSVTEISPEPESGDETNDVSEPLVPGPTAPESLVTGPGGNSNEGGFSFTTSFRSIFDSDGSIRTFDDSSFLGFFANRLVDGQVRDDLNFGFTSVSIGSSALSIPFLTSGNVPVYGALQAISLVSGAGALATGFSETSLAGFGTDASAAYLAYQLGVTTTPFGRATLSVFETTATVGQFLFYEAGRND